jgi:hypothetical protein
VATQPHKHFVVEFDDVAGGLRGIDVDLKMRVTHAKRCALAGKQMAGNKWRETNGGKQIT